MKHGYIKVTPGNVVDYNVIEKDIGDLAKKYKIEQIGFDPWAAHQLAGNLADGGLEMVEMRQGAKTLSPPTKELEKLIRGQQIEHGGSPVMRWMINNVTVKSDENENIRPVKMKGTKRIDGVVALIMALGRAMMQEKAKTSVYEERGLLSI